MSSKSVLFESHPLKGLGGGGGGGLVVGAWRTG